MSDRIFEELIADLLRSMGYLDVRRVGGTADRGVDVEGYREDEFGHKTKYIVQCKFYDTAPVSSPDIQKFAGALTIHGADRGIFFTSSTFTREAIEIAEDNPITLIDGDKLAELCTNYDLDNNITKKTSKETLTITSFKDLYKNLSFGTKGQVEPFILPKIEPIAFIEGFSHFLKYGCEINLSDIEITGATITLRGFRTVDWDVNKVWHDSQGRVRARWSGKGLLITDEKGNIVYDVGNERSNIRRAEEVNYVKQEPYNNYRELASKFKISYPKIRRIAYKRMIQIDGIPNQDIYCTPQKKHIASKITLNYLYKGKKCHFSFDCIKGKVDSNRPSFSKSDARKIIVQEYPEFETAQFEIKDNEKVWTVTINNLSKDRFNVYKSSGKILTEPTHEEIVVEKACRKAKSIFSDSKYDQNSQLKINFGKVTEASWELSFTSENGEIAFTSTLDNKLEHILRINDKYALEIAQRENRDNSELVKMWKGDRGYDFLFKDPVYEWQLHINYQAKPQIISMNLTWEEAIKRATNYLIEKNISNPENKTKIGNETKELYELRLVSEIDGTYDIEVYQTPTEYSCEIVKMKITEARARYLAEQLSEGDLVSFKGRYWGFGKGWVATIIGEKGKQKEIKIMPDGEITDN
ncbi:MAG: restriction endonuclease [Candidatus Bathyarchaeota archaeon]|nr:restriction endonuclease [Candidatus Bathyarchaeota archaeon]